MRYYTKEWYDLMQKMDYTIGVKKIPDKEYSDKEIKELYEKALRKEVAQERRSYNEPPCLLFESEELDPETFDPSDWLLVDEETGTCRPMGTFEEVKAHLEREEREATLEFENRLPFDPEETIKCFKECHRVRRNSTYFPKWVYDQVDKRILALDLMPESVYLKLKKEEKANKKAFRAMERAAEKAFKKEWNRIPKEIYEIFEYHDASVLSLKKSGKDIIMVLRKDGMWCEGEIPYDRVIFKDAVFIEREQGLRIVCHEEDGDVRSNCWYLYDELYRTKDGGYEFHLMVTTSKLKYITIRCRDIVREENSMKRYYF